MLVSPVKSAARVLEVFEYFSQQRAPRSLSEISETLGYPQSSTTVLLKSLTTLGYLNYDRVRRVYFPTMRVSMLGDWVAKALLGQGKIFESMRDVHSVTGETVSIVTQNDIYIQYISVIQSRHQLRFHTPDGAMRPITRSASGWLLMAGKSESEIDNLVRRANMAIALKEERMTVPDVLKRVDEVRTKKLAYAENIPLLGGATICVPLPFEIQGQPVVLGLGGALERIRPRRAAYTTLLRRVASELNVDRLADAGQDIEF